MSEKDRAEEAMRIDDGHVHRYLGDGVYAIYNGYGIWLHANDDREPTDRIFLEPEVLVMLNRFAVDCAQMVKP